MVSKRNIAGLMSSLLIAGCTVGPDYSSPSSALPDRYVTTESGSSAVQNPDPTSLAAWWINFKDPILNQLIEHALGQNLELEQARARISQAEAGSDYATAALLPSGNASAQASRNYQSTETPEGRLMVNSPDYDRYGNSYDGNVSAQWEIDIFGGLQRNRESAISLYASTVAQASATRLGITSRTAETYIRIRGLQARIAVAEKQLRTRQELLEKISLLKDKGLASDYQVSQAEGNFYNVKSLIPTLQDNLAREMNAVDVLLGAPPGTYRSMLSQPQGIPAAHQINDIGSPADLLTRRPDIISAERLLAATNADIGAAIAEYYPKFSISGLIGTSTSVSSGNMFTGPASQAAGIFGLQWRLFDFGRINADIKAAKGRNAEALASYRLTVLHAAEDVENALSSSIHTRQQAESLKKSKEAFEAARETSYSAYKAGTSSLIDVLYNDDSLLAASDNRVRAQVQSTLATVSVYKALGGGW